MYREKYEKNIYILRSLINCMCPPQELFLHWKATYNVTGFLVDWEAMNKNPSMYNITYELNQALNDEDM